jgi:uncharacterized membrane protein
MDSTTHAGDTTATSAAQSSRSLRATVQRLEADARLDEAAERLHDLAGRVADGSRGEALRGNWLGHAFHPFLTDFPLGCWISAGILDLVGGKSSRQAAQRLVGFGLLMVPPTVASGLAEYATIDAAPARRVGAVHAAGNGIVAGCYLCSWRARRRGHHGKGVMWALMGGALAWFTGYLGGHLSFGRGVGVGERGPALSSTEEDRADIYPPAPASVPV